MQIKTVLFDFGGVIYKTPDLRWIKRWKALLGLDGDPEISQMLANPNESPLITDICLGKIPEDVVWQKMAQKWRIKPGLIRRFRRRMMSRRSLNKPILRLMESLHGPFQTGILSNAGDQTRSLMVDVFGLDRYVDAIIISAEEKCIKPDPEIYQIAMDRLDATPDSSLFIDDYLPNVEGARDFGMTAIHYINTDQALQTIRHLLEMDS